MTYALWFAPPADFPEGQLVEVKEGESLGAVANRLADEELVRSALTLRITVQIFGGATDVKAGTYYFNERQNALRVAARLIEGSYGLEPIAVRIPEGATVEEMAVLFDEKLERFDPKRFRELALPLEGYLFPDTYFFLPTDDEKRVVSQLHETFREKIKALEESIAASGRPLSELVTMASILEKEAHEHEVKRQIAGVLWNRLEIGMPLQVDAAFLYFLGRTTYDLTMEDLQTDSPYNTYRYKGLPPGPIGSPSLSSIEAAATPVESDYLYYLADRNGITYFSRTFEEHKRKKAIYVN